MSTESRTDESGSNNTGPDYSHPSADVVFACPECDRAGQLYERQDGSIRCCECGTEMGKDDVVQRGDRRGENLSEEDRRRGGNNAPERSAEYMARIGSKGGRSARAAVSEDECAELRLRWQAGHFTDYNEAGQWLGRSLVTAWRHINGECHHE